MMEQFELGADFLNFDKESGRSSVKKELDLLQLDSCNLQHLQPPQSFFSHTFVPNPLHVRENHASRLPLDLSTLCKLETIKSEIPYSVNYKIQDGKHIKMWQCQTCKKEFGHQYTLMRHLPTHTDERKFQCVTCGKAFRQMSTLSQHRAIHSHERPYVCEVCKKTFNRVSTLISHRKTHTGVKPHQCHLCNKAFHQKGNLRNHIFTHTNERPYKCEDCGKGFNQMSNLMCHKLKVGVCESHQRSDKPKYFCQLCSKSFSKRTGLRNHEQLEHGSTNSILDTSVLNEEQKLSNAIFVEPIKTKAMQLAIESNQIPFALLRPLNGIPVLVRVLPAGNDKQMLVPASAEDLKMHGQISVTPRSSTSTEVNHEVSADNQNLGGSTVQIKIPVVATVIQQSGEGGHMSMSVVSPGPSDQAGEQKVSSTTSYIFSAIDDNCMQENNNCFLTQQISSTAAEINDEIDIVPRDSGVQENFAVQTDGFIMVE